MLPLFYRLFLPSSKKTEKKHSKNKEKFACRDPGRHPSRKDNRAEALWIPKTAWRLLCNLYISGSKRLPTECERAHNQDSLFTWRTASALSSFLAFSPILLAFSLFPFPTFSRCIARVKSAVCIKRCIAGGSRNFKRRFSPARTTSVCSGKTRAH